MIRISLTEILYVLAFAVAFSSGALWAFGLLDHTVFPLATHIAAGIVSTLVFSVFLLMFASVRAWTRDNLKH